MGSNAYMNTARQVFLSFLFSLWHVSSLKFCQKTFYKLKSSFVTVVDFFSSYPFTKVAKSSFHCSTVHLLTLVLSPEKPQVVKLCWFFFIFQSIHVMQKSFQFQNSLTAVHLSLLESPVFISRYTGNERVINSFTMH